MTSDVNVQKDGLAKFVTNQQIFVLDTNVPKVNVFQMRNRDLILVDVMQDIQENIVISMLMIVLANLVVNMETVKI